MKITINMTSEQAEVLDQLFAEGKLAGLGVSNVSKPTTVVAPEKSKATTSSNEIRGAENSHEVQQGRRNTSIGSVLIGLYRQGIFWR